MCLVMIIDRRPARYDDRFNVTLDGRINARSALRLACFFPMCIHALNNAHNSMLSARTGFCDFKLYGWYNDMSY